ncbi:HMG1 [Candida jiufengensis]|uniref:HMG1 n=1 Tax=Candida jiufengensis TaxID=497108 RepID=UPI0022251E65|nr:HMG1 [Candida jiufengensis]KAI5955607.1 HMG1 [Candida jiufengensis]
MLSFVPNTTGAIAKTAAHRPIHFIVIPALLASIAYLFISDDYIPDNLSSSLSNDNIGINYYHSPKKTDQWIPIDDIDINKYSNSNHITLIPLRFRKFHNSIPKITNSIIINGNEQILLIDSNKVDNTLQDLNKFTQDGIQWKIRNDYKIGRYYDYFKYLFLKIQESIKNADNFDILLIFVAYIAMWYTLIKVFFDMKQIGSKFWLAFSTLVSSTFAFLFALVVSNKILDCKVSFVSLSEGIPFLVAIIGFKHKVSIATSVSKSSTASPEDVPNIVGQSISSHTLSIFRDHIVVIGALLSCALYANHLTGLRNFCILSSLILTFDLILVHTFFAAILGLKIEINRARRTEDLKDALEEDGISSLVAARVAEQSSTIEHPNDINFFESKDYSILSFKVIMSVGFIAFHVFWLGSSWLYSTSDGNVKVSLLGGAPLITESISKQIPIGSKGTVLTILPTRFYMPSGVIAQVEDSIFFILTKISSAIRDSILSKVLLFCFGVSIFTNVYFLNASRYQVTATQKLLEQEISRPQIKNSSSEPVIRKNELEDNNASSSEDDELEIKVPKKLLPLEKCIEILKDGKVKTLNNDEVSSLVVNGKLPLYALEKQLADNRRAVVVRRKAIAKLAKAPVLESNRLPYAHYDYDRVFGACCENVIGYMPIPVGVAGPLIIDGKPYHIPMATTEGCLVASTMRGCKAINAGGGVETVLTRDGMTRGPCVRFPTLARAGSAKIWIDSEEGQKTIKKAFNSTSRFARLQHIQTALAGTLLFIRFRTTTGDAMGMNMISKGVEYSLKYMVEECGYADMEIISVSGNYCTDKKPAAINWIEGRGKSIVAEARIPAEVVQKVLKSDVDALVELNISKNLVGSAMAGSVGGFNAHAANLVTAVYLACGQDPAQNVESSNCITLMNKDKLNGDLQISVSMPSIEVGTIGGGTILEPQGAMLDLLGVRGPHPKNPGDNARQLAKIVASAVLAAELSLCSALAAGHLVQSHMQHNRAAPTANATASTTSQNVNSNGNGKVNGAADLKRLKEGSVTSIYISTSLQLNDPNVDSMLKRLIYKINQPFHNLTTQERALLFLRLGSATLAIACFLTLLIGSIVSNFFNISRINCAHLDVAYGLYKSLRNSVTSAQTILGSDDTGFLSGDTLTNSEISLLTDYAEAQVAGAPQYCFTSLWHWCYGNYDTHETTGRQGEKIQKKINEVVTCLSNKYYVFDYVTQLREIGLESILAYAYQGAIEGDTEYEKTIAKRNHTFKLALNAIIFAECVQLALICAILVIYSNRKSAKDLSKIPNFILHIISIISVMSCCSSIIGSAIITNLLKVTQAEISNKLGDFGVTFERGSNWFAILWLSTVSYRAIVEITESFTEPEDQFMKNEIIRSIMEAISVQPEKKPKKINFKSLAEDLASLFVGTTRSYSFCEQLYDDLLDVQKQKEVK